MRCRPVSVCRAVTVTPGSDRRRSRRRRGPASVAVVWAPSASQRQEQDEGNDVSKSEDMASIDDAS